MMFLRSRRTMIAVAAASSLVLTATAVPQSPFSPVAAQAATANKTQDTNLPIKCTVFAAGGPKQRIPIIGNGFQEDREFTGQFHVTMPEQAAVDEVFEAVVNIDPLAASHPLLKKLGGSPSFAEGNANNKIRFAVKGDVELVESSLPATLDKGVLTVEEMMQPSRSGDTVTIAFAPLKLKFKAKSSGAVEVQTPEAYRTPDGSGRVRSNNMFHGEGIAGTVLLSTPGLRITCLTDRYTRLGVTAVGPLADFNEPTYADIEVKQQDTATSTDSSTAPAGTTYAKGANAPAWASVATDGTVTVNPDLDVAPGEYTVPVVVKYPDTSADNTVVKVKVTVKPKSELNDPKYTDVTVKQGDEATAPAPTDVADGAKFAAGAGAPAWVTVHADGTVTVKPGLDIKPGDYTVPVKVTYPDNTGDDTTVNVTVTVKPTNEIHNPEYTDTTVKPGEEATVPAPTDVADGTKFTAGEGAPAWATVNEDGAVTLKPGKDVEPDEYNIPVVVTYPDGSTSTVELKVNVEKQENPSGSSGSSNDSSSSSGVTGSSPLGKFFAALFGTLVVGVGLFGLYNWARAHGYVR